MGVDSPMRRIVGAMLQELCVKYISRNMCDGITPQVVIQFDKAIFVPSLIVIICW